MAMKKILVTGFDPFGGEPVNPALEAVRQLNGKVIRGYDVITWEIPTVFGKAVTRLIEAIDESLQTLSFAWVRQEGGPRSLRNG